MKIGIIGSDNSHANTFSKTVNIDNPPDLADVQISHIWGIDPAETADKVSNGKIPNVATNPTDMIGQIDAAILVLRHGGLHRQYAKPFLRAQVPIFVDKPLSCSTRDARVILELADKYKVPVTSFSTVRYDSAIQNLKNDLPNFGSVTTGDVASVITPSSSEYGGMIFYGIHATELMLELFGHGVERIYATNQNDNTIAIASWPHCVVTMHFMGQSSYLFSVTIHGKKKSIYQNADAGDYFVQGLKRIIDMFRTKKSNLSNAELFEPVAIHEAIEKSLHENREVTVEKL